MKFPIHRNGDSMMLIFQRFLREEFEWLEEIICGKRSKMSSGKKRGTRCNLNTKGKIKLFLLNTVFLIW